MARTDPQMNLRVPVKLKEQIEKAAFENNRTITAEAVSRLEQSFISSYKEIDDLPEPLLDKIVVAVMNTLSGIERAENELTKKH